MTAVCLILLMAVWVLTADKNTYTSISALRSVAKGEAQTFYQEAMARYEIYTDESITDARGRSLQRETGSSSTLPI